MPNRRQDSIDILHSPQELAIKILNDQVDWAERQLAPNRTHPVTRFLHERGLNLDLSERN